jgi:hypothetical protein
MTAIETATAGRRRGRFADVVLSGSAAGWLAAALIGQWLFVYYIALFYGSTVLSGDFRGWTRNTNLLKGYVAGDTVGNWTFAVHALLAGYVALGGVLQVVPALRRAWPRLHRWNGRVFLTTAIGLSLTGLYMVWVRGATTNLLGAVGISGNGAVILVCAGMAWRTAWRRDFAAHRRWALRAFLVANGQWFFRVGIFGWLVLNHGPRWMGANFDGFVPSFWAFGCYLVPLAVLELYLRAKAGGGAPARIAMAGVLGAFALLTLVGTFGVYMVMWRPLLAKL